MDRARRRAAHPDADGMAGDTRADGKGVEGNRRVEVPREGITAGARDRGRGCGSEGSSEGSSKDSSEGSPRKSVHQCPVQSTSQVPSPRSSRGRGDPLASVRCCILVVIALPTARYCIEAEVVSASPHGCDCPMCRRVKRVF